VGIIDTGIDVLHEAFQDGNGTSRIIGVWNQRDNTGPSPHSVDATIFTQDYGTLYVAADIEGFISNPNTTPGSLRDPSAHGTHVASIAAGRALGAQLADGLAPDASLIVVIPDSRTEPGNPPSLGYSVTHIDALHFLKSAANGNNAVSSTALPIAVNVSLGMNAGAHDGLSMVEAAFDSVTNSGRDPGYVIVKSAGNERGRGGHARVRATEGGFINIEWDSSGFRFQDYIEVWYRERDELSFELIDPAGNTSAVVDENQEQVVATLGGNQCRLNLTTLHPDNGDNLLSITILPQTDSIQTGRWKLRIKGISLRSGTGFVDAWVERDSARAVRFVPDDPNMTLSIPGTAHTVIAVGASDSKIPFSLTDNSSFGLTRDNRAKPDIVAPGAGIVAALANDNDHQASIANTGTSMAAPHVTGALALVMSGRHKSGKRQYNSQQLRKGLIRFAQASGGFHNEGSGWGVLDAGRLYQELVAKS
jgi:endonuclease G